MSLDFLTNIEFWKYLSIPLVAGFVGWSTNWVAIKLLFFPIEPIGKPPWLGWQGILPSKAEKMGAITVDTTLSKLGSLSEVFKSMSPEVIAEHMAADISPRVEDYIDWIMLEESPNFWKSLPEMAKRIVYTTARQNLPEAIHKIMNDIGDRVETMVDLKQLVIKQLVEEKRLVNRIFLECGAAEFRFIIISGLYLGFAFGIIQMIVWLFFPQWWILPLCGIIVGYATNWIALRIIFQPLHPIKIGPYTIQGLFLKRQRDVAAVWCDIVAKEIITLRNIIANMLHGKKSENTHKVIRFHMREVVEQTLGVARPMVRFAVGNEEFEEIENAASEKAIIVTASAFDDPDFNRERARLVKELMEDRMIKLSPEEFQYLLRPAFQEEEIKLILLGAFLGLLAGIGQLVFVFGNV